MPRSVGQEIIRRNKNGIRVRHPGEARCPLLLHGKDSNRKHIESVSVAMSNKVKGWIAAQDSSFVKTRSFRHARQHQGSMFSVLNPKWGERPLTTIVLEPGHEVAADEIRHHRVGFAERGFISGHAVPSLVEFVERLPKTSVGNVGKLKSI
jgi:acyl-CoA synthetase (AMP-forming)/AMP-acid ligase II